MYWVSIASCGKVTILFVKAEGMEAAENQMTNPSGA